MTKPRARITATPLPLPPLPRWIVAAQAESIEEAAFRSGAALAQLHMATASDAIPQALWRERLALAAAETCAGLAGRREGAKALRDAVHLTRPGDDPGPAGKIFRQWSQAVVRPISVAALGRALEGVTPERIALCLDATGATPVERAAEAMESVLANHPRAETQALILADAVLAGALGWPHLLPLISLAAKPRDMKLRGNDLRLACHRVIGDGAAKALPLAADLARGAARLRTVAPKLRAKGAARAVELFLSRDVLAPAALVREVPASLSDRAARRLCDRLVELGALRELTGRDTFRLYGL